MHQTHAVNLLVCGNQQPELSGRMQPAAIAPIHFHCSSLQGHEPIIASSKGGKVPIDPKSVQEQFLTATSKNSLKDGISASPQLISPKSSGRTCDDMERQSL